MNPIGLNELQEIVSGVVVGRSELGEPGPVRGVVTDSRRVQHGDLFVALPGKQHHGGEFLSDAARRGAEIAIVGPGGGTVCGPGVCASGRRLARPLGTRFVESRSVSGHSDCSDREFRENDDSPDGSPDTGDGWWCVPESGKFQ